MPDISASVQQTVSSADVRPAAQLRSVRWVLKRAVFGLVMLFSVAVGAAVLLDATIDPTLDQASE